MSHAVISSCGSELLIFHHLDLSHNVLLLFSIYRKVHVCLFVSGEVLVHLSVRMFRVCGPTCLLLVEFPLNLLVITGVVHDGSGQLGLNVSQPGTQAAHVFIQLLHRHQGLPQLLHPGRKTEAEEVNAWGDYKH